MKKLIEFILNCITLILVGAQICIATINCLIHWDNYFMTFLIPEDYIFRKEKYFKDKKQKEISDKHKIINEFINECCKEPQLNDPWYKLYNDKHEEYGQQSIGGLLADIKDKHMTNLYGTK